MKILVTGGAGYVGHFVTKKLLEAGHTVTVLDNLSYGNIGISPFMEHDRFSFVFGDIGNLKSMVKSVKGQDAVIALAAIVGDPACNLDEDETIKTNFLSTKILADVCDYYGVKRIVFASSCSVYGDTKDAIADENFQLNPLSLYARTRVMSEEILLDSSRNISPVILRLSTVFGASKRMRFDLVVNFLTAMAYKKGKFTVFGGNQWRPNLHVQDAADIFIQALFIADEALSKHRIYNVGMSSNNLTIDEMAEIAKR
ncbi:NAD-dependent epimerase/dehydratase, partial [Patescibacteria group bacterium]|nr:NAD-dependent epimerase/dehydratase [Patescibacteria group bacterium]